MAIRHYHIHIFQIIRIKDVSKVNVVQNRAYKTQQKMRIKQRKIAH